ncbi:MAG: aspartate kinase [Phycisphaerales bacterium JB039]
MPTLVQKFGGSSVADTARVRRCAQRAYDACQQGHAVVVVVSAMGKTTDRLIEMAHEISADPLRREMDQLMAAGEQVTIALTAIALRELGQDAISMTAGQAGLKTDAVHTRARVRAIERDRIQRELDKGRVVVVAGFQGTTDEGDVTTLGRGGSDTSAVAIAAAVGAEVCEIYTDVDGVYTADPRIVPEARKIERISYEAMLELAALGAKVMAPRAVLMGAAHNMPIHVRHSMLPDAGTMIVEETPDMEQEKVTGVALKTNLGRVTITELPVGAGAQARLFARLAEQSILVDDIIQNQVSSKTANVSFTVDHADLVEIKPVVEGVLRAVASGFRPMSPASSQAAEGASRVPPPSRGGSETGPDPEGRPPQAGDLPTMRVDIGLCKVSAVGVGMRTHTGVAATMFRALSDAGVNIENITTSEIKISCILSQADGERAMRAVHEAFNLGAEAPREAVGARIEE